MHIEQNVRTRTKITHDKFGRNKTQNSRLTVILNCFFLIISEMLHKAKAVI